ncbi:DUF4748 domain-containing protein [Plectropomus leopardus]|uniref:DUF4748 domain-containing protein n=1 Tax=Plectropomus leopardus TaxID=160734 RepID=UPI001C4CDED3|nr:DUF4748 domain-containing protein [Plectropomus leopardus]
MPDSGTNMAAHMTAVRTALKGVHRVPGRWLLTQRSKTSFQCLQLPAAQCRQLHVSSAAFLCSSGTEPQRSSQPQSTASNRADDRKAGREEEEEDPEYIPRRKAKNPMMKIGYAWMIGLPAGIIGFLLTKREVDKNRLKQLKIRQRMKRSNEGEYDGSRYSHHTQNVKVDQ